MLHLWTETSITFIKQTKKVPKILSSAEKLNTRNILCQINVFFHCYIALVTQTNVSQIYIFLIIHLLNNDKFLQNYGQQQTSTVHSKTLPASKR